jgi:thiosulfate/3-mercaptopyruvate sulfurtransferase
MNIQQSVGIGFVALTALSISAFGQGAAPLLVDVDWLSQHVHDSDLVLLHVGDKKEYDARHIPGARFIAVSDVTRPAGGISKELMVELPAPEELRAKVAGFGISDDSRIVVYFGSTGISPAVTRVVFTLDYLGLGDRISVLNGGMPAWTANGGQVNAIVPRPNPGKLRVRETKPMVADAEMVKSINNFPGRKLVDARAPVYYKGTESTYDKSGHIPGAVSIPFSEMTDDAHNIDRGRIVQAFKAAGIKPGDTVVAYCHIGMQATMVIFGARLLGNPVMLYDGSFQDWATNNRGPVEK